MIDRVLEEPWAEVCDIIQKAVFKTIPKKKKWKRAKWLSEEALQIAEKIREAKGKGEKETIPICLRQASLLAQMPRYAHNATSSRASLASP